LGGGKYFGGRLARKKKTSGDEIDDFDVLQDINSHLIDFNEILATENEELREEIANLSKKIELQSAEIVKLKGEVQYLKSQHSHPHSNAPSSALVNHPAPPVQQVMRINLLSNQDKINLFLSLFRGRTDVLPSAGKVTKAANLVILRPAVSSGIEAFAANPSARNAKAANTFLTMKNLFMSILRVI
jgi:hypothetical protein